MHNTDPFSPFAFLSFFAALWIAITFIIASCGWRTLAGKYTAAERPPAGATFRAASASIGRGLFPANYKGCLIVVVAPSGIFLKPWIVFRFFHPPLLIPWRSVKNVYDEKFWLRSCARLEIAGFDGSVRLYGGAGRAIITGFAGYATT